MNWVLLRGLGRESRHWFDFPESMAKHFGAAGSSRILTLDLPGFGHEKSAAVPVSIQKTTDFIREKFLAQKKTTEPWSLLGISLGGMVALDWVDRYPEDFKSLVLVNSSSSDLSAVHHRLSLYAMYRILRAGLTKDPARKELELLKMISNIKTNDPEILKKMREIGSNSGVTLVKLVRQLTAALRFQSPTKLKIPVLVLASLKDAMVDVRCSKALAERFQAPIKFHPNAGHDLTLDDPAWAAERVHEFTTKI